MDLFEAHITYAIGVAPIIEHYCPNGWKFSKITGDPILGKDSYCYLTSYDKDAKELLRRMQEVVAFMGVPSVRCKVEKIIYDTKTGRNEIAP